VRKPEKRGEEKKRKEKGEEGEEEGRGGGRRPLLDAVDELLHYRHTVNLTGDGGGGPKSFIFFPKPSWRSPRPISYLELPRCELLQVEVPKTMVSTSLKVPIHLPHPNPPPP
jgi:hypothetical protein